MHDAKKEAHTLNMLNVHKENLYFRTIVSSLGNSFMNTVNSEIGGCINNCNS